MVFNLDEHELTSITADASEFVAQESLKSQQSNVAVTCDPITCEDDCECTARIDLSIRNSGTYTLKVHAVDSSNNVADLNLPVTLRADTTEPVVTSLTANKCGAMSAIGPKNNFMSAIIQESDSGLRGRNIRLDLRPLLGSNLIWVDVRANECTDAGGTWLCNWGIINPVGTFTHGQNIRITFSSPSHDDAKNTLVSDDSYDIFFDANKPVFLNRTIIGAYPLRGELIDYPVTGGTVEIIINISEDVPTVATADFSDIADVGIKKVDCVDNVCRFKEIGPLYTRTPGDIEAIVPVNITDCVGNVENVDIKLNISYLEETPGNIWTYNVGDPMPAAIDTQTMEVIQHKIYFPLRLSGPNPATAEPILQRTLKCVGETGFITGKPDLLGNPSITPMAKFTLRRGGVPPNPLVYNCTISTITRTSTGIISLPEIDNVTFTIPFENLPLGTIDDALQRKMNDIKSSPLVRGKWIGQLDKLITTLENVCALYNTIATVAAIIDGVAEGLALIPITKPAGNALGKVGKGLTKVSQDTIGKIANPLCKAVSCNWGAQETVKGVLEFYQSAGLSSLVSEETTFGLISEFSIDPKDSMITSIATFCIPGILHNLQKARAIECTYVFCIQNEVSEGVPAFFCEAERASQWCRYVWGELFQIVPFAQFIDDVLDQVKDAIRDPINTIIKVTLFACTKAPDTIFAAPCRLAVNFGTAASGVQNLVTFSRTFKDSWNPREDICERI